MYLKSQSYNWNQVCKLFLQISPSLPLSHTFLSVGFSGKFSPHTSQPLPPDPSQIIRGFQHSFQWKREIFLQPWQNFQDGLLLDELESHDHPWGLPSEDYGTHTTPVLPVTVIHISKEVKAPWTEKEWGRWWFPKLGSFIKWRRTERRVATHNCLPHMLKSFPCQCQVSPFIGFWNDKQ